MERPCGMRCQLWEECVCLFAGAGRAESMLTVLNVPFGGFRELRLLACCGSLSHPEIWKSLTAPELSNCLIYSRAQPLLLPSLALAPSPSSSFSLESRFIHLFWGQGIEILLGSPSWSWLNRMSKILMRILHLCSLVTRPSTWKGCYNDLCTGDFSWKYQQIWRGIFIWAKVSLFLRFGWGEGGELAR